jgi:hypothetical protein
MRRPFDFDEIRLPSTTVSPPSVCRHLYAFLRGVGLALGLTLGAHAAVEQTPFDLVGPKVSIQVKRGATTLPIAEVPVLAPHDRLKIIARVAEAKTTHYLMVAAFLRGPTDPPPDAWFFRCDTWKAPCDQAGLDVEVPEGAQQMMLFFAPQTGGDYRTLVNAVRGKPGAFVRAAQQLRQAGLDRARLDRYLALLHELAVTDPGKVKAAAPLIARSLAIKIDEKCLDRIPALQAPCLTQGSDALILNDGHGESLVSMVTTGVGRDLAIHAGGTPLLGSGNYSSVIGSILDFGRLMDSLHTAQYQYIPALPSVRDDDVTLMLNTPPSFHNPMSVLVAALPAVERPTPPTLRTPDAASVHCTAQSPWVLPVEGDALVYSTHFAHDVRLEGRRADGSPFSLPAQADAPRGGFLIQSPTDLAVDESEPAQLVGQWGFDAFTGPIFHLASPRAREWQIDADDRARVVAGREAVVSARGEGACLSGIHLTDSSGHDHTVLTALNADHEWELRLPLAGVHAGTVTLHFTDQGAIESAPVTLTAFQEPSRLDRVHLHVGDRAVTVDGQGLAQLASLEAGGFRFEADGDTPVDAKQLRLGSVGDAPAGWSVGMTAKGTAHLHDGRALPVSVVVLPPRPQVHRLALSVRNDVDPDSLPIRLGDVGDLPSRATVTFSLQADAPNRFTPGIHLEAEAPAADAETRLDLKGGGLTLIDSRTLIATLDLPKSFGAASFGPLQYRVGSGEDLTDWLTLGHIVRLPSLKAPVCPAETNLPCSLPGRELYLLESVSANPDGSAGVHLEAGFPGDSVLVPRPKDGHLYLRLRDDPAHPASVEVAAPH